MRKDMATSIYDYVGEYTIRVGSGNSVGFQFQIGDKIYIGTGEQQHAPEVKGTTVGLSVYRGSAKSFPPPADTPAIFSLEAGNLVWIGLDPANDLEYQIQFTLIELTSGGTIFKYLYGAVLQTDPDVVGVWGADDQIP